MGSPLRIGVVGVGKISEQYFAEFPKLPGLKLVAVADLDASRAAAVAAEQGVPALTVDELIASPDVDAVLNLTIPAAHAEVALRALAAGKHVYGEKPLALNPDEATPVLRLGVERGLRVGSAPDTVLGTGVQTARALLDDGRIGTPVAASAFWTAPGHELWHPAPQFYYSEGGGPLFDMGPYYLSALVTLLGPVVRVSGSVGRSGRERTVATGPLEGTSLRVEIDTHVSALLEHASGVTSTVMMSFDVWAARLPRIEIYGTLGTIAVPDPNRFSDATELYTSDDRRWREVEPEAGYADAGRGYGLADMARAIETDRPHRASAELAFHVLEIMDAILRAAHDRSVMELTSTVERPAIVPEGALPSRW
ncbi:Gfo/Idh/MocA family oxidoreductase [Cryobacterium sp. TMT2-18-3]|uniref:Gfo/Idh/MocA family protein n=1 Tax=unclassified Cryobacterium TaxID=2649013 RepID=UPI00106C301A|nr:MULTISPECIES: Gfo/Idh/MocA family oxidoreductase [unclassified Cryobacterium]TFC32049.1 Gfo/Idh/MocA family oxidoreductase [Cryobacterium sp. TMT2-18-2]TFC64932.1 Gfo/Idh/MocA family oxidoreductase [Cryobacterium sp. TMT2-18-3]